VVVAGEDVADAFAQETPGTGRRDVLRFGRRGRARGGRRDGDGDVFVASAPEACVALPDADAPSLRDALATVGSSTDSTTSAPGRCTLAMPRCVGSTSAKSAYAIRGCAGSTHGDVR